MLNSKPTIGGKLDRMTRCHASARNKKFIEQPKRDLPIDSESCVVVDMAVDIH